MAPVLIFECNDQLWTTSQEIARLFGRRHGTVLRSIRRVKCSDAFRLNNFVLTSSRTARGQTAGMGFVSRSGLVILVTGRSKRAYAAMEAFLDAFEAASLRNSYPCRFTDTTQ